MKSFLNLSFWILIISCGTKVGNPTQPTDSNSVSLPDIDQTLEGESSLSLVDEEEDEVLALQREMPQQVFILAKRVDRLMNEAKKILDVLKSTDVVGVGKHPRKGPGSDINSEIFESSEFDGYDYSAIVCKESTKVMEIHWNSDETRIKFVHNLQVRTLEENEGQEIVTETDLTKYDDYSSIQMWTQGKPFTPPELETDGDYLTEYVSAQRYDLRNYEIQSVGDWSADLATSFTEADDYLVGRLRGKITSLLSFVRITPIAIPLIGRIQKILDGALG